MAFRDELARKGIHLSSSTLPLLYWLGCSREFMLWGLGAMIIIAVIIETLRHSRGPVRAFIETWFGGMLRPFERNGLTGATFVVLANWLAILLFEKHIAVAALLILSISDSLASLIGVPYGRRRFLGGSLEGSGAFLVSACVISLLLLPQQPLAALAGAAAATVIEAATLRIGKWQLDDNLTVPLVAGAVMSALT